MEFN